MSQRLHHDHNSSAMNPNKLVQAAWASAFYVDCCQVMGFDFVCGSNTKGMSFKVYPFHENVRKIYLFNTRLRSFSLAMPAALVNCLSANASTCLPRLYFFMSTSPMTRNGGRLFQQVFIAQDPLTPWHLQSVRNRFFTIWTDDGRDDKSRIEINSRFFLLFTLYKKMMSPPHRAPCILIKKFLNEMRSK